MTPKSTFAFVVCVAALAACGGKPAAAPSTTGATEATSAKPTIVSFAVDPESHTVDKVGGTDGAFHADGANDIVFAAQIEGPFKAVFLIETDETGKSAHDYGADTLVQTQQAPEELGGMLEQGKFTSGIAVFEDGKLLNEGNGSLGEKGVGPGHHALKLYVNEDPRLGKSGHMQLLLLARDGTLVKGPVIPY
jgi:hypothetical protein